MLRVNKNRIVSDVVLWLRKCLLVVYLFCCDDRAYKLLKQFFINYIVSVKIWNNVWMGKGLGRSEWNVS